MDKENSKEYKNDRCREQLLHLELSESKGEIRKLNLFISLQVVSEAQWVAKIIFYLLSAASQIISEIEAGKQTTYWDAR